jgi:hypothetical protein
VPLDQQGGAEGGEDRAHDEAEDEAERGEHAESVRREGEDAERAWLIALEPITRWSWAWMTRCVEMNALGAGARTPRLADGA